MKKTNLESGVDWADLRYNPVQGLCPNTGCSIYDLCYMKRPPFCFSVNKNPTLRLDEKKLMVKLPDEPQRIFVQDNLELFHEKTIQWVQPIIDQAKLYPQHTFLFLTKLPEGYARFDFPDNCWLGATVTKQADNHRLDTLIQHKREKNLLFVSCEPLLGRLWFAETHWNSLEWFITGALTGAKAKQYQTDKGWVNYLRVACESRAKSLFLKNNLKEAWGEKLIQEYPRT